MPRDHPLRPDGDAEKFYRLVRMKQHPDRQPGRAITMRGRNHDDGRDNQDFEGNGIDGSTLRRLSAESKSFGFLLFSIFFPVYIWRSNEVSWLGNGDQLF